MRLAKLKVKNRDIKMQFPPDSVYLTPENTGGGWVSLVASPDEGWKLDMPLSEAVAEINAAMRDDTADTDRIDWIDQNMDCDMAGAGLHISMVEIEDHQTLRQAIDEAMENNDPK